MSGLIFNAATNESDDSTVKVDPGAITVTQCFPANCSYIAHKPGAWIPSSFVRSMFISVQCLP